MADKFKPIKINESTGNLKEKVEFIGLFLLKLEGKRTLLALNKELTAGYRKEPLYP